MDTIDFAPRSRPTLRLRPLRPCRHLRLALNEDATSGILYHCEKCGLCAYVRLGCITVRRKNERVPAMSVEIPWKTRRDPIQGLDYNQSRSATDYTPSRSATG